MTENKLNETAIMKDLEKISKGLADVTEVQLIKPHNVRKISYLCKDVLELLNRKNAEIERLKAIVIAFTNEVVIDDKGYYIKELSYDVITENAEKCKKSIRAEAIKAFANLAEKRICEKVNAPTPTESYIVEKCIEVVYQIAKEMGVEL